MSAEIKRDLFGFPIKDTREKNASEHDPENLKSVNSFDSFMFGGPRRTEKQTEKKKYSYKGILDQIDVDEMVHHVDTLIGSAKELKPLFGNVRPLLQQFINKK
jgi:hypothetical protein